MRTSLPQALALAVDGVVTRAALRAAGVDGGVGDRMVAAGRWTRLAPSTWAVGVEPPTDPQLVRAAAVHAGADAVVTGALACRAHALSYVPQEPVVEVLIAPGTRVVSTAHVVVHQTHRMPEAVVRDGTAYAPVVRATVDAARRTQDLRASRALVLGAVCSRRCTAVELAAEVEAGHSRGSGVVRRAVEDAGAGAWSAPEAEAADLVRAAVCAGRLPPFLLNPQLTCDGLAVGRPDGWLVGTPVCWQVDSREHHEAEDRFDATLAVHDAFAAHGLTVLHVTPRRLRLLGPAWVELLVSAAARAPDAPRGLQAKPEGSLQDGPRRYAVPTPVIHRRSAVLSRPRWR